MKLVSWKSIFEILAYLAAFMLNSLGHICHFFKGRLLVGKLQVVDVDNECAIWYWWLSWGREKEHQDLDS